MTLSPATRFALALYAERYPDSGYTPDPRQMRIDIEPRDAEPDRYETGNEGD